MFNARFLQTTNRNLPHQSRLFARRAALRCPQVAPAQPPSEMNADTVAPETKLATALMGEATPTGIQPSMGDLAIAAVGPAIEVPDAVAVSAAFPVTDPIATKPSPAASDAADAHESTSSVPTTKGKKRGKKREKSVSVAPRRKRASRKKNAVEKSGGGDCTQFPS